MTKDNGARIPQPGEPLILADGRRFVVRDVDGSARGWWFRADSQDGGSVLQGNLVIAWDGHGGAWRPAFHKPAQLQSPAPLAFAPAAAPEPTPLYLSRGRAQRV